MRPKVQDPSLSPTISALRPSRLCVELVPRLPELHAYAQRPWEFLGAGVDRAANSTQRSDERREDEAEAGEWRTRLAPASLVVLRLASVFLLLWFVAGCGPLPGKPRAADVPIKPRDMRDFAVLYQQSCAGCHGAEGRGNGALALANPVYLAIASDETLRRATALGVPGTLMPPFARSAGGMLNDEQINILVSGMRSHWAKPEALNRMTPPPYAATVPGDAQRGASVFATFCATCHGPEGKGTPKSGSIVDGSYLALVSDQSLRTTVIAGRPNLGHPDWRDCVPNRPLAAQQVTDVVAWLTAQRAATPGQPYPSARANP